MRHSAKAIDTAMERRAAAVPLHPALSPAGKPRRTRGALTAGILLSALAGCATQLFDHPNRPYWLETKWPFNEKPEMFGHGNAYGVDTNKYNFAVIEFDEQGDLWNPEQKKRAIGNLNRSDKKPLLIVYIHGWRHNASPQSGDLKAFVSFLGKLSGNLPSYRINGVYVGWRGKTSPLPLVDFGSFWSRREETDRVASVTLTATLFSLARIARKHQTGGRSIFIGHSFGARILEKAYGHALAGQYALSDKVLAPADLVLLVNPASEALNMRRLKLQVGETDPPEIFVITSKNDWPNRSMWPKGIGLPAFFHFEGYRHFRDNPNNALIAKSPVRQKVLVTRTVGMAEMMIDYDLVRSNYPEVKLPARAAFATNLVAGCKDRIFIGTTNESLALYHLKDHPFTPSNRWPYEMKECKGVWVIQVDSEILDGHGGSPDDDGIFNSRMADFSAALFNIRKLHEPSQARQRGADEVKGDSSTAQP